MPIGTPCHSPPKSGCNGLSSPARARIRLDRGSIGSLEMSRCHGLSAGRSRTPARSASGPSPTLWVSWGVATPLKPATNSDAMKSSLMYQFSNFDFDETVPHQGSRGPPTPGMLACHVTRSHSGQFRYGSRHPDLPRCCRRLQPALIARLHGLFRWTRYAPERYKHN